MSDSIAPEGRPEWPRDLDIGALKAAGWKPVPFQQFILKVHSRCNLACDYCYMYELADQSWRDRPVVMSQETVSASVARIAEHVRRYNIRDIRIVLHGGEPLLAGTEIIEFLVTRMRTAIRPETRIQFGIQTNGALLNPKVLDLLKEHNFRVSVSLDGGESGNDLHRRYRNGQGSYREVSRGIELLRSAPYRQLFSGLLAVIDLRNDPVQTYEDLSRFDPPRMDFLLPHATWADPPPEKVDSMSTPYGEWLIAAFNHWWSKGPSRIDVRFFQTVIQLILGQRVGSEQLGLEPADLLVIETDGAIEQIDTLKAAFEGAADTGFHVGRSELSDVLESPGIVARQIGVAALSKACASCRLRDVCGGGQYAHRYRQGSGFRNPSVYCADLIRFIDHAKGRVQEQVDAIVGPRHH
ncbi:FxsB family cyclophane-forming radical SAM/SPASM peptide maturase [Streptomyces sp. NPDC004237]|uniref:FxsB family cyclophane-forming radical SAM/SPASM peptide maturase n=1 Tax=Streptomyces sp. NPDC004237 TaxID=3154455 RepID=UPI0033AA23D9